MFWILYKGAVVHSAKNEKTPDGRIGRQEIHVYLKKLPTNVSHLYFTLSSWKAATLENFKNPRLQFYDASSPDADLCGTTFTHALSCQAVIMCSVVRIAGNWQIFECDSGSCPKGNAKMYNPLCERITGLISDECEWLILHLNWQFNHFIWYCVILIIEYQVDFVQF
jgi:hypothetical protein